MRAGTRAGDALGEGLVGRRFFRLLRERLGSGGAFAFNAVGGLDGSGLVGAVLRAATATFEDVRGGPVVTAAETYDAAAVRNVVVVGVRSG